MPEGTAVDRKYIDLAARRDACQPVSTGLISPCGGKGFSVNKGRVFRIVQGRGPADRGRRFLNRGDPSGHFMYMANIVASQAANERERGN